MKGDTIAGRIAEQADSLGEIMDRITGFVCVTCFVIMTGVALLGVFFRYVMRSPFMWTEEVARYLLVWMGFLAISQALRQGKHIKVEILDKLAPPVVQKIIGYGVDLLIAAFLWVFLKQGYLLMVGNNMTAATFNLSMFWVKLALPVSAALAMAQLVLRVISKSLPRPTGSD
jgi:TRAP-type transport system small permease protein